MLTKLTSWLLSFLELQLVISLLSLPILIYWGLGISLMSILGNLIFSPLLTLFLWTASLFSVCSILHIPNSHFISALNQLTNLWNNLLVLSKPTWLIGFNSKSLWIAIAIALFIVLFYTVYKPKRKHALPILILCVLILLTYQHNQLKQNQLHQIDNLSLYLLQANRKTYLIDNGALCSKHNFYSWIDYTIIPALIKSNGTTAIDTLFLYKPSKKIASVATQFAQQMNIKTIFVTTKQNCYTILKKQIPTHIKVLPITKIKWVKSKAKTELL